MVAVFVTCTYRIGRCDDDDEIIEAIGDHPSCIIAFIACSQENVSGRALIGIYVGTYQRNF